MAVVDKMLRYNERKPRLSLVPLAVVEDIARALEYGARKYKPHDWRKGGEWSAVADSLLRHAHALTDGEEYDPESGLWHGCHIGANLAFLSHFRKHSVGVNDLYLPGLELDEEKIA